MIYAAYGAHGAIISYTATEETNKIIGKLKKTNIHDWII